MRRDINGVIRKSALAPLEAARSSAPLLQGLRILPGPLGSGNAPVVHRETPALEQVRVGLRRLHPVPDPMSQSRLDHLPGMVSSSPVQSREQTTTEAAALRQSIADNDWETLEPHGGIDAAIKRVLQAEEQSAPTKARTLATTDTWRTVASTPNVRRAEPRGCRLADGFVRSRSVAIPLSTHPFTATQVHRNPIHNGGCNDGDSSEMECVRYLYQ